VNHRTRLSSRPALIGALVVASTACTTFPDASNVVDLRVLGVQTDPSDVFLGVTGLPTDSSMPVDPLALGIDPTSILTIHVTPLIVDPTGGGVITWDLSACPNNPYGPTPPGSVMGGGGTDPGGGANNTVGSTLCDDAPVRWALAQGLATDAPADVPLTSDELLTSFKHDVYFDQFGQPHGGFDLGMPLNLQLTVHEVGVSDVRAIKRVVFWAQTWPDQTLDQIPMMSGVSLFAHRDQATVALMDPVGTLDSTAGTHVSLADGLWLHPDGVTAETYRPTVINRDPPYQAIEGDAVEERIRYAFYATAGHFDPPRTVNQLTPPGSVGTVHLESHYVPPATLDGVPIDVATGLHLVNVWVVVRDDRGGESWIAGRLALDP
jgi:hypothetical protein